MTIQDFEGALHDTRLRTWFQTNVDNLLAGKDIGFPREDSITDAIVNCMNNPHVHTRQGGFGGIPDILEEDINNIGKVILLGEAAHNGTFQSATPGIEHIILRFYQRYAVGYREEFYALMYLMDIENLDTDTTLTYNVPSKRSSLLKKKHQIESYLNALPGGILIHEPFHNLKSGAETTILNYDIYVLKFQPNSQTVQQIHDEFSAYSFYNRVGFKNELLESENE